MWSFLKGSFKHPVCVCVYFRPRGEHFQLRRRPHFKPVQPGPPAAIPQWGHHRRGAGGNDAAVRRWSQEGRAQEGRLARYCVWNVQDWTDGRTVSCMVFKFDEKCFCNVIFPVLVCLLDPVYDPRSSAVQGETEWRGNHWNITIKLFNAYICVFTSHLKCVVLSPASLLTYIFVARIILSADLAECLLSRLGAHRHGRSKSPQVTRRGRYHSGLPGTAATRSHRASRKVCLW